MARMSARDRTEIIDLVKSLIEFIYSELDMSGIGIIDPKFIYPLCKYLEDKSESVYSKSEYIKLSTILERSNFLPWHKEIVQKAKYLDNKESYLFNLLISGSSEYYALTNESKAKKNKHFGLVVELFEDILFGEHTIVNIGAAFDDIRLTSGVKLGDFRIGRPTREDKNALTGDNWKTPKYDDRIKTVVSLINVKIKRHNLYSIFFPFDAIKSELISIKCLIVYISVLRKNTIRPLFYYYYTKKKYPDIFGFKFDRRMYKQDISNVKNIEKTEIVIDRRLITQMRAQWSNYSVLLDDSRIKTSSSRFLESISRQSAEDTIIDHWIALESIFDANGEISDKVSTYYAYLTESKFNERKIAKNVAKLHYGIRSALVHGGNPSKRVKELFNFIKKDRNKYSIMMDAQTIDDASFVSLMMLIYVFRALIYDPSLLNRMDDKILGG